MAKFRKPFFKKSHQAWYVQLQGKQIRLGETEEAAFERYHELMAAQKKAERFLTPGDTAAKYTLDSLYCEFMASAFKDRAPATKGFYSEKLVPFIAFIGGNFLAEMLKPMHVEQWVAKNPHWKRGTIRTVWQAVQRMMRWGEKSGRLTIHSTVCDYSKPGASRRTVVISQEEYEQVILPNIPSQQFRDLVTVAWECGARPQELLEAEARHFDAANSRLVFPQEEAKVEQWPRIIYLSEKAAKIVKRLTEEYSVTGGKLFRNSSGRPWTNSSVNCEWIRVRHRLGFAKMRAKDIQPSEEDIQRELKLLKPGTKSPGKLREKARMKCRQRIAVTMAPKYCLYHFRHSFLNRMLKSGVDALTCAILMGHRDPSMIARTYQHLSQSPDYLLAALTKKAAG